MGIQLKGIDSLLRKLDKVSNIKTKDILQDVAKDVTGAIKEEAQKFSDTSYLYAGEVEVRDYGISCFIDVGFSSDTIPFELWKPLWFQHWGFMDYGLNFNGQYYISNNKMWFNSAIQSVEKQTIKKIKDKTKAEIRKALA